MSEVSAFEVNIRLVGGFLAIYALTNDKVRLIPRDLQSHFFWSRSELDAS